MSDLVAASPSTPFVRAPLIAGFPPRRRPLAKRPAFAVSPLSLADRMISLAQDADRAGYRDAAASLVTLVYAVLDQRAVSPRP